jgi:hypothetical protein
MDAVDHYAALLARRDVPHVALCLTVVGLDDVDQALTRYDGFPADRRVSVSDVGQWLPPPQLRVVVAQRHGDHVLLVEDNGFHGAQPQVLRRLSRDAVTAASVFWNVNAHSRLSFARDGRLLSMFDFVVDGPDAGDDPSSVAALRDGLDFGRGNPRAAALAFLERVSGVRLTADWVHAAHPASVVVEPEMFDSAESLAALLPGVRDHHLRPDSSADPRLPEQARSAFRERAQRRAAAMRRAADTAVAAVLPSDAGPLPDAAVLPESDRELLRAQLMAAARETYRHGVRWYWDAIRAEDEDDEPAGGGIEDLLDETAAEEAAEEVAQAKMQVAFAYAAARGRLHADPRLALQTALTQARRADPDHWPQLRQQVLDSLTVDNEP